MDNYGSIGLNGNLQPSSGLIGQPTNFLSNTQTDTFLESFSASQISAGAIASAVKVANNGLINNSLGTNIIDLIGLNSVNNFGYQSVFNGNTNQTTTSTAMVDVTGGAFGSALVLTRDTNALVFAMCKGRNTSLITSNGVNDMTLQLYDSFLGTLVANVNNPGYATTYTPDGIAFTMSVSDLILTVQAIVTINAGTHNYKLQYCANNGGTAHLGAFGAGYILLGS